MGPFEPNVLASGHRKKPQCRCASRRHLRIWRRNAGACPSYSSDCQPPVVVVMTRRMIFMTAITAHLRLLGASERSSDCILLAHFPPFTHHRCRLSALFFLLHAFC